ncbi:MAG: YggS family pyridoxal phosphate-dependent enzyme [Chloroflexota bacterium]
MAEMAAARVGVLERIAAACERVGRRPDEVTLVAVSKTVPLERLRLALVAGHDILGENRVQEAASKIPALRAAQWHLIGHLQKNKAARAIELFDVIEAVDSLAIATRLDRLFAQRPGLVAEDRLPVYLQVNVDADPAKQGFALDALGGELEALLALPRLELRGLMTVGWLAGDPEAARPTFARLRQLSEALRATHAGLGAGLSMGMSDDFEIAIEEGSTLVRVGRALFGERPIPAQTSSTDAR